MTEPRLLVKIQVGPRCVSFPGEDALIGVTGFFVRGVQLLAGTPVVVRFCRGRDEVSVPGTVYAHYADLGLSVEFQESSGLAVLRLASLLAAYAKMICSSGSSEKRNGKIKELSMNSIRQPKLTLLTVRAPTGLARARSDALA